MKSPIRHEDPHTTPKTGRRGRCDTTNTLTNATAESINAKIQRVKRMACGYRNRERFRAAIMFHLGGLDLYPASITHTES